MAHLDEAWNNRNCIMTAEEGVQPFEDICCVSLTMHFHFKMLRYGDLPPTLPPLALLILALVVGFVFALLH
jgi:hypothetical protein